MAAPNFSHLFMFIDRQSTVLHLICALYASSMKRLITLNRKQTEQMGLLEKRKFLMEALIFCLITGENTF